MKKLFVILSSIFVLCLCAGCGNGDKIAQVNDDYIYEAEYTEYLDNLLLVYEANGYTISTSDYSSIKKMVIEEMENAKLTKQIAEKLDCIPTDKEVQKYFENEMKELYGSYDEGVKLIESYGINIDFFKNGYYTSFYQENIGKKLVADDKAISKDEAKKIYKKDPESYDSRTVSHILIQPESKSKEPKTDENGQTIYTDAEWDAAYKEAVQIIKKLDKGEDFAKIAKKSSDDTGSASNGGDLGEITKSNSGDYVEGFVDACFKLTKVDEYTAEPFKSTYGYHIIICKDIKDNTHKYGKIIKSIIDEDLKTQRSDAFNEYYEKFKKDSKIEILKELNTKDNAKDDKAKDGNDAKSDNKKDDAKTEDKDSKN